MENVLGWKRSEEEGGREGRDGITYFVRKSSRKCYEPRIHGMGFLCWVKEQLCVVLLMLLVYYGAVEEEEEEEHNNASTFFSLLWLCHVWT